MRIGEKGVFIICVLLLVTAILSMRVIDKNDFFGDFKVERGEAVFFEPGVILAEFEEINEILFEENVPYRDFITLETEEETISFGVRKVNGVYHLIHDNLIPLILETTNYIYEIDKSHCYTINTYEDYFSVILSEKSYIAECMGFYPFVIKEMGYYKWNLKYGEDHKFTVKCDIQKGNYFVEYTAWKGEKTIWSATDVVPLERNRKPLKPEYLEISENNPIILTSFHKVYISIPSIHSKISPESVFRPIFPIHGTKFVFTSFSMVITIVVILPLGTEIIKNKFRGEKL